MHLSWFAKLCFSPCPGVDTRDYVVQSVDDLVLRGFNFCVIDEVDSILIDEARTPLIISGSAEKPSDRYYKAAKIASVFERDVHYTVTLFGT